MGLLTDPSSGQGKLTKFLLKYYIPLCTLLYIGAIAWFSALASPLFNANTYFSENALLPGLVKSLFKEERGALQYYQELKDECEKYDNSIPYPWILAKFRQLGLDSYTHNFTLHSPLSTNKSYHGRNVYGILRAPRASSTEALVLSAPYRPPSSVHPSTLPSIALQLAFAKFAVKEKYWAKDIIFLITDHEQLGMQAWLEAYHGVTCGNEGTLDHGTLKGRAGAIQAAINLELHGTRVDYIDLKIEGLNGQLPNLDLFNLAGKICLKEGVFHTFKGTTSKYFKDPYKEWWYYFKNMLSMIGTQATGIPNGNHGLFLRFGIQALTLEGIEETKGISRVGFLTMGHVIEGIFRSMNNLLERFHQSFFFYILASYDKYISIGLYMPSVCMIAASLIIKACAKWFKMQEQDKCRCNYVNVLVLFVAFHLIGALAVALPEIVRSNVINSDYDVSSLIFNGLIAMSVLSLLIPFVLRKFRRCSDSLHVLCIFSLLELGTAIICLSMNNISLGIICGAISVPIALLIDPNTKFLYRSLLKVFWLSVQPLFVVFLIVLKNTHSMYPNISFQELLLKGIDASQKAITYSIVDSMIYGNWLYTVVCLVLLPNWLCFWCVTCGSLKNNVVQEKKDN